MSVHDWWYNDESGAVMVEGKINLGIGKRPDKISSHWHGPYKTEEDATRFYVDNKTAHPEWKEPTTNFYKSLIQGTQTDAQNVTADVLGTSGVNVQSWFVRIAEIVLGIALIGVGVAKLTGASNVISRVAKVV